MSDNVARRLVKANLNGSAAGAAAGEAGSPVPDNMTAPSPRADPTADPGTFLVDKFVCAAAHTWPVQSKPALRISAPIASYEVDQLIADFFAQCQSPRVIRPNSSNQLQEAVRKSVTDVQHVLSTNPKVQAMLSSTDEDGYTPLMSACALTDKRVGLEISKLLIEAGGRTTINMQDKQGYTALHWAAACGSDELAAYLIHSGATVDCLSTNSETPLMRASRLGQTATVKTLLEAGADPMLCNMDGQSALDVAGVVPKPHRAAPALRDPVRATILAHKPSLRVAVLSHADCLRHGSQSHQESPFRVEEVMRGLKEDRQVPQGEVNIVEDVELATETQVLRAHSRKYFNLVNSLKHAVGTDREVPFTPVVQRAIQRATSDQLKSPDSCDTSFNAGSHDAALRAAGAACKAVDMVAQGQARHAFCVVRPPGHHAGVEGLLAGAERDSSCGFCIFNNVAIAALHALATYPTTIKRVAIVDWDVHHGNGTEEIVRKYNREHPGTDPLMFFSVHLFDNGKVRPCNPEEEAAAKPEPEPARRVMTRGEKRRRSKSMDGGAAVPNGGAQLTLDGAASDGMAGSDEVGADDSDSGSVTSAAQTPARQTTRRRVDVPAVSLPSPAASEVSTIMSPARAYRFYPGSGGEDELRANIINAPVAPLWLQRSDAGTARQSYRQAIDSKLLPALRAYRPDLIMISAGFDAGADDLGNSRMDGHVLKGCNLRPDDFAWMTDRVLAVAGLVCPGRVVSVLEGGYGMWKIHTAKGEPRRPVIKLKNLVDNCAAHVRALTGK